MAKITKRTGKTDKMGGIVGAIVLGAFAVFGFFIPLPSDDPFSNGFFEPMDGIVIAFKFVWIIACGAGCIYNIYMAVKGEGISKETVDIDSNGDPLIQVQMPPAQSDSSSIDFEEKLRKLSKLKDDGLITGDEYELKRKQIMEEKW